MKFNNTRHRTEQVGISLFRNCKTRNNRQVWASKRLYSFRIDKNIGKHGLAFLLPFHVCSAGK
jgi:hypothetical protein